MRSGRDRANPERTLSDASAGSPASRGACAAHRSPTGPPQSRGQMAPGGLLRISIRSRRCATRTGFRGAPHEENAWRYRDRRLAGSVQSISRLLHAPQIPEKRGPGRAGAGCRRRRGPDLRRSPEGGPAPSGRRASRCARPGRAKTPFRSETGEPTAGIREPVSRRSYPGVCRRDSWRYPTYSSSNDRCASPALASIHNSALTPGRRHIDSTDVGSARDTHW